MAATHRQTPPTTGWQRRVNLTGDCPWLDVPPADRDGFRPSRRSNMVEGMAA